MKAKVRWLSCSMVCLVVLGLILLTVPSFGQKVTLTWWTQYNAENYREAAEYIIDIFEKENPDVKIAHRIMPNIQADEIVRTAFAGGNPPDLSIEEDSYTAIKMFNKGQIRDLTDWYAQYGDRFPPGVDTWVKHGDRYFVVPTNFGTLAHMFYDVKTLEKLGIAVPTDYDEFLDACETIKGEGLIPIGFGNKDGWPGLHWFGQLASETLGAAGVNAIIDRTDPDAGPRWTDPGFVRAIRYFEELQKRGYFPEGAGMMEYDAGKMQHLSGRAPFFFTGSWYESFDFGPEFEWGFFRFPHIPGEVGYTRNDGLVAYLSNLQVSTACENPELAYKFLEVFTRPEVMHDSWFEMTSQIPAAIGAVAPEELSKFQNATIEFAENNTGIYPWLEVWLPPAVGFGGIYNGTTAISAGVMTAVEFGQSVEKAHEEELRRATE